MNRRAHSEERLDSTDHDADHTRAGDPAAYEEDRRRERFGGINWGSAFFGWLVAIAVTVLLVSIVGAVTAAIGSNAQVTQSEAEREAGTIGIVAAVVLLVALLLAYYAGGYVAGRMSRFDGGKQGVAVWLIGLIVTLIAVALGVVFGREYNILERVSLPTMPIPTDTLTWGGAITAAAILVGTLLAAMGGGKVGTHYHSRVDNAGYRY
ncbi:MAG TPA: hypothetical protein VFQ19_12465 [Nocardioidaceae bacterium]|nr:hypothetical protein [Nocardioidaceae bacterium]